MFRQGIVVLHQDSDSDHDIINIFERQRALRLIPLLCFDEAPRVLGPMSASIEMMGCVISVVKTMTITLWMIRKACNLTTERSTYCLVNQCDAGAEIRVRIYLVNKTMLPPIPNHHPKSHKREGQNQDK
jgi:hypothetical protein